ncbi:UDP-N-acetylglucosamine--N-acetylmuramyl-(pentapeptide) pyrophosphoryl-undecaprenol N-acetylglucosamine transferase [bacterium NHP-B]|nr:UDP-N-acetylglucosamine--N-acetylmuramyl-(pentapeptide) pyrophosphoryl-undecaprenol N-acetylglucosamine transferase [bacterium NHP-B]
MSPMCSTSPPPRSSSTPKRIVFAAGGTGGHMFPAIAMAEEMHTHHRLSLMTDMRGLRYLTNEHQALLSSCKPFPIYHFQGSWHQKIKALFWFMYTGIITPFSLYKHKPQMIVGFGGFASFWPMMWGFMMGVPTILYQPDVVMGQTNRWLKTFARHIATGFPSLQEGPSSWCEHMATWLQMRRGKKQATKTQIPHTWVGFITRAAFTPSPYDCPTKGPLHLLVLGGSQGAHVFSHVIPQALSLLPAKTQKRLVVTQQCREEDLAAAQASFAPAIRVTLSPFIHDVAAALAKAHFVIARAGTSTLGEVAACVRPVLLVPYPHAKANHQYINAQTVEENGAGFLMDQKNFHPKTLARFLKKAFEQPELLKQKAETLHTLFGHKAAQKMHDLMQAVMEEKRAR